MKEHDTFTLNESINLNIRKGSRGTIVHIHNSQLVEAEFKTENENIVIPVNTKIITLENK